MAPKMTVAQKREFLLSVITSAVELGHLDPEDMATHLNAKNTGYILDSSSDSKRHNTLQRVYRARNGVGSGIPDNFREELEQAFSESEEESSETDDESNGDNSVNTTGSETSNQVNASGPPPSPPKNNVSNNNIPNSAVVPTPNPQVSGGLHMTPVNNNRSTPTRVHHQSRSKRSSSTERYHIGTPAIKPRQISFGSSSWFPLEFLSECCTSGPRIITFASIKFMLIVSLCIGLG